jgi:biopolymer transport protein ExbD
MTVDVQHAVEDDEQSLNVAINTTPLVDVMLVMLIIFLVTIPVVLNGPAVVLPTYRNIVTVTKPENIVIFVTEDGVIHDTSNKSDPGVNVAQLRDMLIGKLKAAVAAHKSFPEVHIRADKNAAFQSVGRIILACQQAGIQKVGFITEPKNLDAGSQ